MVEVYFGRTSSVARRRRWLDRIGRFMNEALRYIWARPTWRDKRTGSHTEGAIIRYCVTCRYCCRSVPGEVDGKGRWRGRGGGGEVDGKAKWRGRGSGGEGEVEGKGRWRGRGGGGEGEVEGED